MNARLQVVEARVLQLTERVRYDSAGFRARLESQMADMERDATVDALRPELAGMGIYEERTAGRFMVRVRIGAGRLLPRQFRLLASLCRSYGTGALHLTTRQDVQIHGVLLEHTPDIVEALLTEGLSSRGGGGNTVRNVTACPRAGICLGEPFDVSAYAMAVAEYLLQHESSFTLPRKFKIAFSGCGDDCAYASVADVGFFARVRAGEFGFSVFAGGGLGPNARGGVKVFDFVPGKDCIEVAEAVRRVFDRHGDRSNRRRARLRYVLDTLGPDAFTAAIRTELAAVKAEGLLIEPPEAPPESGVPAAPAAPLPPSCTENRAVLPESRPGLYTLELRPLLGDISADDLVRVSDVAEAYGEGLIRLSQLQDILLTGVPAGQVAPALAALKGLSVDMTARRTPKTVACAGAATCRIGLCRSHGLAEAIAAGFGGYGAGTIRISGCGNSCAAHQIGAIGLEGCARRVNGRLLPCYGVYCGARLSAEGARLGEKVGVVPAKRVPELLARVFKLGVSDPADVAAVVREFEQLPEEVPEDWYMDFGATSPFGKHG